MSVHKHRYVHLTADKTIRRKETVEFMKPHSRSLFQPINNLFEFANMMWIVRMDKAWRLFYIDFLCLNAMKKNIFDIQLSNSPPKSYSKRKNMMNGGDLATRIERLMLG